MRFDSFAIVHVASAVLHVLTLVFTTSQSVMAETLPAGEVVLAQSILNLVDA